MNKYISLSCWFGLFAVLSSPVALGSSLRWELSPPLAPAVKQAAQQKRLLVVKIWSSKCPECTQLDKILLGNDQLTKLLSRHLTLAYHAEEGEGINVALRYNIVVFPTILIIGADGLEVGRVTGALSVKDLSTMLRGIVDGSQTLPKLEKRLAQRPDDVSLRLRVGMEWAYRGMRSQAIAHLDQVINADSLNHQGLAAKALLTLGNVLFWRGLRDYSAAEKNLRHIVNRFPSSPEANEAKATLTQLR